MTLIIDDQTNISNMYVYVEFKVIIMLYHSATDTMRKPHLAFLITLKSASNMLLHLSLIHIYGDYFVYYSTSTFAKVDAL